jgi:hypothetical protein
VLREVTVIVFLPYTAAENHCLRLEVVPAPNGHIVAPAFHADSCTALALDQSVVAKVLHKLLLLYEKRRIFVHVGLPHKVDEDVSVSIIGTQITHDVTVFRKHQYSQQGNGGQHDDKLFH